MKNSSFCKITALLLALSLLLGLTGCSTLRAVGELADTLIESAKITNSKEPIPQTASQASSDTLQLLPEKEDAPSPEASVEKPEQVLPEEEDIISEETALPDEAAVPEEADIPEQEEPAVLLGSAYTSRDDVALYIHLYKSLPPNFITKSEARKAGWEGGSLEGFRDIPSGSCIGGDRFGNNEGLLPKEKGRTYYECDIDTQYAKSRGAKRIVYSNDGLIYYTEDHYESFELLYGEE